MFYCRLSSNRENTYMDHNPCCQSKIFLLDLHVFGMKNDFEEFNKQRKNQHPTSGDEGNTINAPHCWVKRLLTHGMEKFLHGISNIQFLFEVYKQTRTF